MTADDQGSAPDDGPSANRPVVYLLCGVPFAGKSTLARALAAWLGAAHLEVDAVVRELGLGGKGEQPTRGEWVAAYREAQRRLDRLLGEGRSVVYDATNFRRLMRARIREIAVGRGAGAVTVLVAPSAATVRARRARNRRAPARPDVPEAAFTEVVEGFQPPGAEEAVVRYDGEEPVAAWIERVFVGRTPPSSALAHGTGESDAPPRRPNTAVDGATAKGGPCGDRQPRSQ